MNRKKAIIFNILIFVVIFLIVGKFSRERYAPEPLAIYPTEIYLVTPEESTGIPIDIGAEDTHPEVRNAIITDIVDEKVFASEEYLIAINKKIEDQALRIYRNEICDRGKQESYFPYGFGVENYSEKLIESVLDKKIILFENETIDLSRKIEWPVGDEAGRSVSRAIHAWYPILPIWNYIISDGNSELTKEDSYILLKYYLLDWIENNFYSGNDYRTTESESFSWYDMSAGGRGIMLANIISYSSCDKNTSDEEFLVFLRGALDHINYLLVDEYYVSHNNHGLYQSQGLLTLCKILPELRGCLNGKPIGEQRIVEYFENYFSSEGVHLEHSTQYFGDMLIVLEELLSTNILSAENKNKMVALLLDGQGAFSWFITPENKLSRIGDTESVEGFFEKMLTRFGQQDGKVDSNFLYFISNGEAGEPLETNYKTFFESGYSIIRNKYIEDENSTFDSYLLLSAAFHSRTHKHADDLNMIWHEFGISILDGPGRSGYEGRTEIGSDLWNMGYWYSDPKRIYVESTHAHNTVEIDGNSDDRKNVTPYGSGIEKTENLTCGLFLMEGSVLRGERISHERILLLNPRNWLIVLDYLYDPIYPDHHHDYTQWFHLNESAEKTNEGFGTFEVGEIEIRFTDLLNNSKVQTYFGEEEPRMQGWISSEATGFSPSWAIGFSQNSSTSLFLTLIDVGTNTEVSGEAVINADNSISVNILDGENIQWNIDLSSLNSNFDTIICNSMR